MLLKRSITEGKIDDVSGVGDNCGAMFLSRREMEPGAQAWELALD